MNAIGAHHEEMEMTTLLAPIVLACDAISGARPGARREIAEAYIKRLHDLEAIARPTKALPRPTPYRRVANFASSSGPIR